MYDKLIDIKLFIEKHKPHLFSISEGDLHGGSSFANIKNTFTCKEINDKLKVDGYTIFLPDTWKIFDQARIIVYICNDIKVKQRGNPDSIKDLPSITLEVGVVLMGIKHIVDRLTGFQASEPLAFPTIRRSECHSAC